MVLPVFAKEEMGSERLVYLLKVTHDRAGTQTPKYLMSHSIKG